MRRCVRPQKTVTAIELTTSLSASTCLARLRAAAASDDWFFLPWPWLNDPMLVRVRGNRFLLMKAAGGPPRNSFRRMFHGQVIEHRGGALIRGRFKMHSFVRFGLVVWFGGVIAVGLLLFSASASRALGMPMKESAPGLLSLVAPILMALFGVVLVRSGISWSSEGERVVVEYMQELLHASVKSSRA